MQALTTYSLLFKPDISVNFSAADLSKATLWERIQCCILCCPLPSHYLRDGGRPLPPKQYTICMDSL